MPIARLLLVLLLASLSPGLAGAQQFPKLSGRVVDAANLLSPEQEVRLTALSTGVESASSRQLVVATIPDLEGRPIEDYGYRLGRAWGIGQSETDNGIMLIVAPKERKVRIEVGYGLEPIMTDALSSTIINTQILPRFRDGQMAEGIIAGAEAVAEQLRLPPDEAEKRALAASNRRQSRQDGAENIHLIIFWGAVLVFIVLPMVFRRGRGRRYRGGSGPVVIWGSGGGWGGGGGGSSWGGGGGGGFSGGGGSFGGGGASGSW